MESIKIRVDSSDLDAAIEKVGRLTSGLKEVQALIHPTATVNVFANGRYSPDEMKALFRDLNAAIGDGLKLNLS